MVMPSLLNFVSSVPSVHGADTAALWLEVCLQTESPYVIVLNDQRHPLGAVKLPRLVAALDGSASRLGPPQRLSNASTSKDSEGVEGRAGSSMTTQLTHLIEATPVIGSDLALGAAAQAIAGATERLWVVVDSQQHHYLGVLDTARLLDFLWGQQAADPSLSAPATSPLPVAKTGMNPYSTVLITHLGHELKTPLTSLLGLSSLLNTQKLGRLTPRQSRYVGLIQQHARRLTAQVNAVLDLGRINSGTLQIMPQVVVIADLCQEAYRQALLLVGETVSPDHPLPLAWERALPDLTVVADPLRLGQMLTYLIYLTLKHQPDPTSFPIVMEVWERWVLFTPLGIQDSGRCLHYPPQEDTVASSDYTEVEGWLELLLTRKLAHLHRGELVMMSHDQGSTRPVLLLPLQAESAQTQLLVLATLAPQVVAGVQAQVAPLNYRLVVTEPGPETLEVVARLEPAAVLVDLHASTRRELLRQLRTDGRTHTCPIVALVAPLEAVPTDLRPVDHQIPWPSDDLTPLLVTPPVPATPPPTRITVLYLRSSAPQIETDVVGFDLPTLLHDCGCQVLEVDDLDQASLITRVWNPDVMVLDPAVTDPDAYLQGLAEFPDLTQLALITLTSEATQAAHQFPKVTVYPCLVGECDWQVSAESNQVLVWLQEVLQVAIAQHPPF
ncbi:MAG: hypothetical protein O3A14_03780 [Cyanobacteria bacterium]|nr:hypothetical protein [Cyanobacteriota bacterium]